LMSVVGRRNASPDIQELAYTCFLCQETHRPRQERPVSTRGQHDIREGLDRLLARGAVSGEIVLPTQPVVIYPGDMRHACVERRLPPSAVGDPPAPAPPPLTRLSAAPPPTFW